MNVIAHCKASSLHSRRHQGFSLVELLISVTLGLLLLAGVSSVFLGSKQSFRSQESLSEVQEAGRFVSYLMTPYIRRAGYLPDPLSQTNPREYFADGWQAVLGHDSEDGIFFGADVVVGGIDSARIQPGSDALIVTFAGTDPALGATRLCGAALNAPLTEDEIGAVIFYVSYDASDDPSNPERPPSLSCARTAPRALIPNPAPGPITATDPIQLVGGIVNMQLLYGVDDVPADDGLGGTNLFPTRFLPANLVGDWSRVVAVRVEVTTTGREQTEGTDTTAQFVALDGEVAGEDFKTVSERRLQRVFSNTVYIRNRLQ